MRRGRSSVTVAGRGRSLRCACVLAGSALAGGLNGSARGGPTSGVIPPAPPTCGSATVVFTNPVPLIIPAGPATVSSTITVVGALPSLWDLNLTTFIIHPNNADLDITLTSPLGTIETITTDNGGTNDDVFNGTIWDDHANPLGQVPYASNPGLVTDATYANLVTQTPLVPEEALGAFIGENPNGIWTLTIHDDTAINSGILATWVLEITALDETPTSTTTSATNPTLLPIPTGPAVVASTIMISGPNDAICDLNLTTFITHSANGDLDVTLTSPLGTVVTITSDNGLSNDNVFNGTIWDDDANPGTQVPYLSNPGLVSDAAYANLVLQTPLVVEEALAAFNGEDPNGTWTLTISDDAGGDGGALNSWTLGVVTCKCNPGQVNLFLDQASFDAAAGAAGKLLKASWNFKPSDLPPAAAVGLDDPLDINSHGLNPDDPWTTVGQTNLWPSFVDNVQLTSNTTPQSSVVHPRGANGLVFASSGFGGIPNNVLLSNFGQDSLDIISGPPAGDSHTAISLELMNFQGAAFVHVTIFDTEGQQLLKTNVNVPSPQKVFLGIVRQDSQTIGHIDIWNPLGGFEGIATFAVYFTPQTCPWDCANRDGAVGILDFLAVLVQWGIVGSPCDFEGGGVSITDFLKLLANWGTCP